MPPADHYSIRVLQSVEALLIGEGFRAQADAVAAVVKRLEEAPECEETLRQLYAVKGWDKVASRLLWLEKKAREGDREALERRLKDTHAREVFKEVVVTGGAPKPAEQPPGEQPPPPSQDLSDALVRFDAAVGILKQRSLQGDEFAGIEQPLVEILQEETDALRTVATADGNHDVVRFCTSLSIFLGYVVDRGQLNDVRTMNIIDNANLTLQTVLQAMGAADYDSLQQTTELLGSPGTLLE